MWIQLPLFCAFLLSYLPCRSRARLRSFDFRNGTCRHIPPLPLPPFPSLAQPAPSSAPSAGSSTASSADIFLGVPFYSGYVNIARNGGEMFYWYFPKQENKEDTDLTRDSSSSDGITTSAKFIEDAAAASSPVIVWLTGGPGCSSEYAALTENGPLTVEDDATVTINPYGWSRVADVIFVDQPLGTGFSSAGDPRNFVTNEEDVAVDMRQFLAGLLELYPRLTEKPFYITGESYAGHYIPAVAFKLHQEPVAGLRLAGIAIGNGWVDPVNQYPAYAQYAFEHNLVTQVGYQLAKKALEICVNLIEKAPWPVALAQCNAVVTGLLGKKNPYDVRLDCDTPPYCYNSTGLEVFLNREDVQSQLGVHRKWRECNALVYALLLGDWITETRTKVGSLLDQGYQVLIYNGDQDFICNWRGSDKWTQVLQWDKAEEFRRKEFEGWHVDGRLAGQIRKVQNLIFLRVLDAGHMVPMDQPTVALKMIDDFMQRKLEANPEAELLVRDSSARSNPFVPRNKLSLFFAALRGSRHIDPSVSLTGGITSVIE